MIVFFVLIGYILSKGGKCLIKKFVKFIPSLLVLITVLYFILSNNCESGKNLLSFDKAYKLADTIALQWNSNSLLYNAGSVDVDDEVNYKNDKRAGWNFDFTLINSDEHYIIEIRDGQVDSKVKVKGKRVTKNELISSNEINLTFQNAIQKSIKKYHLKPGVIWAIGYHCEVFKVKDIPQIAVIGLDTARMQQKIYYNLSNGDFIKEIHKKPIGGGLYIDNVKINLFKENNWGVIGINNTENGYITWGYKITDIITLTPFLILQKDNKRSDINIEDIVVYSWTNGNKIFTLTESNLSYTNDNGIKWIKLFDKEFSLVDYYIDDMDSIYILTSSELYHVTNAGNSITNISIPKNATRVIKDKATNFLYAISDGNLYIYNNKEWDLLDNYTDIQTLDAINDYIIIGTKNVLNRLEKF